MTFKDLLTINPSPRRGLLVHEWVILAYALITLCIVIICATSYSDVDAMIWTRVRLVTLTLALWGLYRLVPCKLTLLTRIATQLLLLGEWYPDTYEINKILPNYDPLVAGWDQCLFGCQPAHTFSADMPWLWFSEIMYLGYGSYYLMIFIVPMLYFFKDYKRFTDMCGIIITSFFLFYFVFILFPVAGPQYYFEAIGIDSVEQGIFPSVGSYFASHHECLPLPGEPAPFRAFVQFMHDSGERPTAAFPSSHVGIATVILFVAISYCRRLRDYATLYWYVPLYVALCFSTVYIKAHYAIDALAGLVFGTVFYFVLSRLIIKDRK